MSFFATKSYKYLQISKKSCTFVVETNPFTTMNSSKRIIIVLFAFFFAMSVMAQQRVSGIVLSEKGVPVIGASVTVEGTTLTTITDEEGRFEISVGSDATIVVSYVGCADRRIPIRTLQLDPSRPIVLKQEIVPEIREPRHHRFAAWATGAVHAREGAFKYPEQSGDYTKIAGEVGLGYQYYHPATHVMVTTGMELLMLNYRTTHKLNNTVLAYGGKQYKLQVPLLVGMEYPWWYWQAGAKVGFFDHYILDLEGDHYRGSRFSPSVAPAVEIGANIRSWRSGVSYKFGVCAESNFEKPIDNETDSDNFNPNALRFTHLLVGLKFTISY